VFFALTTQTLSADLRTKITPCHLAGILIARPADCIASMGLASIASHKLGGILSVGTIFKASVKIGQSRAKFRANHHPRTHYGYCREKKRVAITNEGGLVSEECSPTKTAVQKTRKRVRVPSQLSARVGSDPLLVQASNGNTSIKLDGILWIKASAVGSHRQCKKRYSCR